MLMDVVCANKSLTTRECKKESPIEKRFQTSLYEHVKRGREDSYEIAKYICENPAKWQLDKWYAEEQQTGRATLPVYCLFQILSQHITLCGGFHQ